MQKYKDEVVKIPFTWIQNNTVSIDWQRYQNCAYVLIVMDMKAIVCVLGLVRNVMFQNYVRKI